MRLSGTLRSWNDDRGFGFIAPTDGGVREIFVHVSAFPRTGSRPTVGEKLTFEVESAGAGKSRAVNVHRETLESARLHRPGTTNTASLARNPIVLATVLLLVAGAAIFGYALHSKRTADAAAASTRCDGRRHCSEMTSCAEAKYFLKYCPGTQMDGDNDGTPCEEQWCTSPFAK
jgi:cold shock CspA family protein